MKLQCTALAAIVLLAACNQAQDPAPLDPSSEAPLQGEYTPKPRTSPTGVATIPASVESGNTLDIPLDQGVYVLSDSGCNNPANAAVRVFDGRGFSGSATKNCRVSVTSQDGRSYEIANDCEDTYSGDRSTTSDSVSVIDSTRFSYTDEGESGMTYRLCPNLDLSDFRG